MKYVQTIMIFLLALLFCLPSALGDEITVPEFTNIKSFSFPDSPALSFVRNLGCGWNLGNTFDAPEFDANVVRIQLKKSPVSSEEMLKFLHFFRFLCLTIL